MLKKNLMAFFCVCLAPARIWRPSQTKRKASGGTDQDKQMRKEEQQEIETPQRNW